MIVASSNLSFIHDTHSSQSTTRRTKGEQDAPSNGDKRPV